MAISALIEEVQAHLLEVQHDPSKVFRTELLESVDPQVIEAIQEPQRDALLNQLSALLPTLQQDPTPVTNLIQNLISSSHDFDFSRVLSIKPPVDFLAGLTSQLPPINLTVLALLEKAKYHQSDIDIVAGKPELVYPLVRLWLCTQNTAVATRAHDVLLALLLADFHGSPSGDGRSLADEGLLWRRIFRDRDIYGTIFSLCSLTTAGEDGQPSRRDKTVAQARLLDMLLSIDSAPVRTSNFREIEEQYGVRFGGGLLDFAAVHMVENQEDVLMHITLIDFYAKYIGKEHADMMCQDKDGIETNTSYALRFMQENGLHGRSMRYYLDSDRQDPLDLTYLYGPSARYLAAYCSTYPGDVLKNQDLVDAALTRLTKVLQTISSGQWAQGQIPKHDFNVMASLPRATIIPRNQDSPLFLIPAKSASPSTFNTLAHIFHGNEASMPPAVASSENAAARALYLLYMERVPNFWTQIVSAAETVAIKDVALAAISVIGAIITAQWAPLPIDPSFESSAFSLPSEHTLSEKCNTVGVRLPQSGIETIMSEPAIGIVVPYLMRPAQTFSNLVGGGRGDVESAAYRVAVAKHDVLTLLFEKLKEWVGTHSDAQEMVATVGRRVAQGPMGGTSEVGGRVGTMEL